MNAFRHTCAAALLVAGSAVALPCAFAAGPTGPNNSNYQNERAVCGQIQQDKAACIREAGAAAQASRNGNLTHASAETYRQNALARCQSQPAQDRQACEQRVLGTGATTIDGSVLGGGAIRETVTPVAQAPAAPVSPAVPASSFPTYRQPLNAAPPATMPPATVYPAPATAPAPVYPAMPAPARPAVTN